MSKVLNREWGVNGAVYSAGFVSFPTTHFQSLYRQQQIDEIGQEHLRGQRRRKKKKQMVTFR